MMSSTIWTRIDSSIHWHGSRKRKAYGAFCGQLAELNLGSCPFDGPFLLMFWLDKGAFESKETLYEYLHTLLQWDAVAVHSGGTACEVIDDLCDLIIVMDSINKDKVGERGLPDHVSEGIDTSWYTGKPIEEVLWGLLNLAYTPDLVRRDAIPVVVIIVSPNYMVLRKRLRKNFIE